jgi:hypothetical protein
LTPDIRPTWAAFQAGNLLGLRGNRSPQLRYLFKQGYDQVFKLGV